MAPGLRVPQRISDGQRKLAAAVVRHGGGAGRNGARPAAAADRTGQAITETIVGVIGLLLQGRGVRLDDLAGQKAGAGSIAETRDPTGAGGPRRWRGCRTGAVFRVRIARQVLGDLGPGQAPNNQRSVVTVLL